MCRFFFFTFRKTDSWSLTLRNTGMYKVTARSLSYSFTRRFKKLTPPTLYQWGSENWYSKIIFHLSELWKAKFIPLMFNADFWWCCWGILKLITLANERIGPIVPTPSAQVRWCSGIGSVSREALTAQTEWPVRLGQGGISQIRGHRFSGSSWQHYARDTHNVAISTTQCFRGENGGCRSRCYKRGLQAENARRERDAVNPFPPKSDQFQFILQPHQKYYITGTVSRTCLFISTRWKMIILQILSLPYLYISLQKVGRMYFLNFGVKGLISEIRRVDRRSFLLDLPDSILPVRTFFFFLSRLIIIQPMGTNCRLMSGSWPAARRLARKPQPRGMRVNPTSCASYPSDARQQN